MNRSWYVAPILAIAASAVLPAGAAARPGWQLPRVTGGYEGSTTYSIAEKCDVSKSRRSRSRSRRPNRSQFGTYTFANGTQSGDRIDWVVFKVALTADGRLHTPKLLGFSRGTSKDFSAEIRRLLAQIQFHYVTQPTPRAESRWSAGPQQGEFQAARAFNPRRIKSCGSLARRYLRGTGR